MGMFPYDNPFFFFLILLLRKCKWHNLNGKSHKNVSDKMFHYFVLAT